MRSDTHLLKLLPRQLSSPRRSCLRPCCRRRESALNSIDFDQFKQQGAPGGGGGSGNSVEDDLEALLAELKALEAAAGGGDGAKGGLE